MIRGPGRLSYVGFSEETRASASSIVSRLLRLAWVEVDLWMLAPGPGKDGSWLLPSFR
jgi:hypothetical protein